MTMTADYSWSHSTLCTLCRVLSTIQDLGTATKPFWAPPKPNYMCFLRSGLAPVYFCLLAFCVLFSCSSFFNFVYTDVLIIMVQNDVKLHYIFFVGPPTPFIHVHWSLSQTKGKHCCVCTQKNTHEVRWTEQTTTYGNFVIFCLPTPPKTLYS